MTLGARSLVLPALACVLGDMDLVRSLGLAGIPCIVVTQPGNPASFTRFARRVVFLDEPSAQDRALVDALIAVGRGQAVRPVLFYENDAQLLMISRNRVALAEVFRFVIAAADLVEDLVDKERFAALALRQGLPVPATRVVEPAREPPTRDTPWPAIAKPIRRTLRWEGVAGTQKALRVDDAAALLALWPRLAASGGRYLVQEAVPGPESRVESYHCYVDESGNLAAEFTGRKIRTYPLSCGHSCALELTEAGDVTALGREVVRRIGLRGVAKLDFKRAPDGRLLLLEINPRFTLWSHLGAVGGVNIPAVVYSDLVGRARPVPAAVRPGVRWARLRPDRRAARELGVSLPAWAAFAWACEAKSLLAWDDPMPALGRIAFRIRERLIGHAPNLAPRKT